MDPKIFLRTKIAAGLAVVGVTLIGPAIRAAQAWPGEDAEDSLYIGDVADNTVKRFDADTGKYLGVFVANDGCPVNPTGQPPLPPAQCLYGPTGVLYDDQGADDQQKSDGWRDPKGPGHFLVANQNVNLPLNGAVNEYQARSGAFIKAIVAATDPNGPPAPRGMVLKGASLFVASQVGYSFDPAQPGLLQVFKRASGAFDRELVPPTALIPLATFHPRGVVIGPDGLLYVSNDPALGGVNGDILRFYPVTGYFKDIFVSNANPAAKRGPCACDFNRPEGLVFSPDGDLYVTSFRADSTDNDKILVFAGPSSAKQGALIRKIDLDAAGEDRAFAQALLFGPHGKLFVPISVPPGTSQFAGEVRRYNLADTKHYDVFVKPGSGLGAGYYLTFGRTNPSTLDYSDRRFVFAKKRPSL
jgi:hypothetical protein